MLVHNSTFQVFRIPDVIASLLLICIKAPFLVCDRTLQNEYELLKQSAFPVHSNHLAIDAYPNSYETFYFIFNKMDLPAKN